MDPFLLQRSVQRRSGRPDGSDALSGVERLRFADRAALLQEDAGPVAAADAAGVDEDGAAILIDVLANDRDADGDPLAITGFRDVVGGTVTVVGGKAQFVPAPGFSGAAGFTYTAQEDLGALPAYTLQGAPVAPKAAAASVAVTVRAVNDAPVNTVPGAHATNQGVALTINGLAVTDVDAGANPLKVALGVSHGTLDLSGVAGLTFASGDGAADAAMAFTGTLASINTARSATPTPSLSPSRLLHPRRSRRSSAYAPARTPSKASRWCTR